MWNSTIYIQDKAAKTLIKCIYHTTKCEYTGNEITKTAQESDITVVVKKRQKQKAYT